MRKKGSGAPAEIDFGAFDPSGLGFAELSKNSCGSMPRQLGLPDLGF